MDTKSKSSTTEESLNSLKSDNFEAQNKHDIYHNHCQISEEQILLEDATLHNLPKYAENLLISYNEAGQRNEAELLIALIYCIALECGFADEDCLHAKTKQKMHPLFFYGSTFNKKFTEIYSHEFPKSCQDENNLNLYKFKLTLINYSELNYFLIAIRTGEYLVVTLTNNEEPGRSWCLSIGRYVLSGRTKISPSMFRNLTELSFLMKEHIFGPVRNSILSESNNLFPGLCGIPVELSHFILRNLSLKDLQFLSKTCWKLRCICVDYYESKYKPKNKPFGSKDSISMLSDSSSAFFRNFF